MVVGNVNDVKVSALSKALSTIKGKRMRSLATRAKGMALVSGVRSTLKRLDGSRTNRRFYVAMQ